MAQIENGRWYVADGSFGTSLSDDINDDYGGWDWWSIWPMLFYKTEASGSDLIVDAGIIIHSCIDLRYDPNHTRTGTMSVDGATPPSVTTNSQGTWNPESDAVAWLQFWPRPVEGMYDNVWPAFRTATVMGGVVHHISKNDSTVYQPGAEITFSGDINLCTKRFVIPYTYQGPLEIHWERFGNLHYRAGKGWPNGQYFYINYPYSGSVELPSRTPPYTAISGGAIQIKSFTATSATDGKFVVWYGDFIGGEGNPVASTKLEVSKNGGAFVNCNKNSTGTHEYTVSGISEGDQFVFKVTAMNTIRTENFEDIEIETPAWVITMPAPSPVTGLGYKSRNTSVESSPVGDYKTSSGEFKSISVLNGLCVYWNSSALATSYDVSMQIAPPSSTVPTSATSSGFGRNVTGTEADMGPRDVSVWHTFVYPGCWVRFVVTAKRGAKASSAVYGEWVRVRGYARIRNRGKFQVTRPYVNVDGVNKNVAHIMVYKNGEWTESY